MGHESHKEHYFELVHEWSVIQCNIFPTGMKDQIRAKMINTNIIVVDHKYLGNIDTKFNKKWTYPMQFNKCTSNRTIFYFSRRTCNNFLLLGTPQDRVVTKVDNVSICRNEVTFITTKFALEKTWREREREKRCDKDLDHDLMCHKDIKEGAWW